MAWLRLDDGFARHKKVAPLTDQAFRLHITAMLHCADQLTDGFVGDAIPQCLPKCPRAGSLGRVVKELESSGLWERVDGGWLVHDFAEWNPSSKEILAKRASARDRMIRARSFRVRANNTRTSQEPTVTPSPSPSPSPADLSSQRDLPPTPHSVEEPEPERDTRCPTTFSPHPEAARELCEHLKISPATLKAISDEFVGYWTIGAGRGLRRSNWQSKFREHCRKMTPVKLAEIKSTTEPQERVYAAPYHRPWKPEPMP